MSPTNRRDAQRAPAESKGEHQPPSGGLPPELLRFAAMGLEFIGAIAGGLLLGWLVDRWTGAAPLWTIVGVVAGLLGGGYAFLREAVQASKTARRDYDKRHPHDSKRE